MGERVQDPRENDLSAEPLYRCAICHLFKTASEFHNSRTGEYTYCRDCRNAYDRQYYAERGRAPRLARQRTAIDAAREWMNAIKADVPCADCGGTFPVFVMHWDHLPGFEKLGDVSTMLAHRARNAILEELRKCELVCANCHVMRTVERARGARRRN